MRQFLSIHKDYSVLCKRQKPEILHKHNAHHVSFIFGLQWRRKREESFYQEIKFIVLYISEKSLRFYIVTYLHS